MISPLDCDEPLKSSKQYHRWWEQHIKKAWLAEIAANKETLLKWTKDNYLERGHVALALNTEEKRKKGTLGKHSFWSYQK